MQLKSYLLIFLVILAGCKSSTYKSLDNIDYSKRIGQEIKGKHYVSNSSIEEYINRVGKRILIVSDSPTKNYVFKLNEHQEKLLNLDLGQEISINKQLLKNLNNEAELAALITYAIIYREYPSPNYNYANAVHLDNIIMTNIARAGYDPSTYVNFQHKILDQSNHWLTQVYVWPITAKQVAKNRQALSDFPQGLQIGTKRFIENTIQKN